METKRIVLLLSCGVGTDTAEGWIVPSSLTEDTLSDFAWERAVEYAESFGIYAAGNEDDYETLEEYEEDLWGQEAINGHWEIYNPKKHDGKLLYGNNSVINWETYV